MPRDGDEAATSSPSKSGRAMSSLLQLQGF